jgi:cell division transport system ATP-binding protein
MISLSHVYKTYPGPVHALRDLTLEIDQGEFVFLMGPSGAGKSTLFKLISAFDRATSGSIQVANKKLNQIKTDEIPFLRRQIGVVFQDFRLLKDKTVFENVALPLKIMDERENTIKNRVNDVLSQVGLKYKNDYFPTQMSGGEQQRVAIARALVHRPGLLIADEPTGNLDPELSLEIMALFESVNAQGTTVLIATHDKSIVDSRKKRIISLKAGCLFEGANA